MRRTARDEREVGRVATMISGDSDFLLLATTIIAACPEYREFLGWRIAERDLDEMKLGYIPRGECRTRGRE